MRPFLRLPALGLAAFLVTNSALALDGPPGSFWDRPVDFSVYATQNRTTWESDGRPYDVRVDEIGFTWGEHFENGIRAGLRLGYTGISDEGRPELSGIGQSGGHLGLVVDGSPLRTQGFTLLTGIEANYQQTSGSNSLRKVENDWTSLLGRVSGHLRLGTVRLSLGGNYQLVSGTERLSGDINRTRHFNADQGASATAGIDLLVGGGSISIHGETGARNSYAITFSRAF